MEAVKPRIQNCSELGIAAFQALKSKFNSTVTFPIQSSTNEFIKHACTQHASSGMTGIHIPVIKVLENNSLSRNCRTRNSNQLHQLMVPMNLGLLIRVGQEEAISREISYGS